MAQHVGGDVQVGVDLDVSSVHRAHARHFLAGTWVQCLRHSLVAVCQQLDRGVDVSGDVGHTLDVEGEATVVGREDDIEESRGETRVGLARVERRGREVVFGGYERRRSGQQ